MSKKTQTKGVSLQQLVDDGELDPGHHLRDYTEIGGIISRPDPKKDKKKNGE